MGLKLGIWKRREGKWHCSMMKAGAGHCCLVSAPLCGAVNLALLSAGRNCKHSLSFSGEAKRLLNGNNGDFSPAGSKSDRVY
jgi:hypothetical protein